MASATSCRFPNTRHRFSGFAEARICLSFLPTSLNRHFQPPDRLACSVIPSQSYKSTGILTCFPSATPFGLTLGADSPCAVERCARNPWTFGVRDFHPHYRYLCQHSHFRYLHLTFQLRFTGLRNAPLPLSLIHISEPTRRS